MADMADRGLSGGSFARLWQEMGWHFLVRVNRSTRVALPSGQIVAVGALAPLPGSHCCLTGVWLDGRRKKRQGHWTTEWATALPLQVVAVWRQVDEEAWLLVTDLPATLACCREYRRRTWEEEVFRDLKGMGWQWQQSRVRQPERVARLILVLALALATLWMVAVAQRVVRRGRRPLVEARSRRECSVFHLGLRYLRRCLATDAPVPSKWTLFPVSHSHLNCHEVRAPPRAGEGSQRWERGWRFKSRLNNHT